MVAGQCLASGVCDCKTFAWLLLTSHWKFRHKELPWGRYTDSHTPRARRGSAPSASPSCPGRTDGSSPSSGPSSASPWWLSRLWDCPRHHKPLQTGSSGLGNSGQSGPTFTSPEWDQVRFFISQQVHKDFPLQLRKWNSDGCSRQVTGMIHLWRFLHLLLGLVRPGLLLRLRLVFSFLSRASLLMPATPQAQNCSEIFSLKDWSSMIIEQLLRWFMKALS